MSVIKKNKIVSATTSSDKNVVEGMINPLDIPLVVKNVLELWDPSLEDIKSLRSVSKVWYKESLPYWRSKACVHISSVDEELRDGRENRLFLNLKTFMNYLAHQVKQENAPGEENEQNGAELKKLDFYKLVKKPYKNMQIVQCSISMESVLWTYFGFTLKSLTMSNVHLGILLCKGEGQTIFFAAKPDMHVAKLVFEKCPNLQKFKLEQETRLQPQFPSLPYPEIIGMGEEEIRKIRKELPNHNSLREVEINDAFPTSLIVGLAKAVKLEKVKLYGNWGIITLELAGSVGDDSGIAGKKILEEIQNAPWDLARDFNHPVQIAIAHGRRRQECHPGLAFFGMMRQMR